MSGDTMFMDNLDEFVNDENKVVTYKWLSQTLQVHVNQAKQMLYAFVQDQRNKKDNDSLHVTYFVAGMMKSPKSGDKVVKCTVMPEEELEAFKSSLDPVTSCHIFSVQKAKLKDPSSLYITDYSALKENVFETNKYSSISFEKAKLRSRQELEKMAEKATRKEPVTTTIKASAASSSASSKQTGKAAAKGGIASMFANVAASKKDEANKPEAASAPAAVAKETSKPQAGASDPKSKKGGSVLSFFSNHTGKANQPAEKPSPPRAAPVVEKKPIETSAASAKSNAPVSKKTEKKKPARVHNVFDSDEDSKSQKKTKRRRIQTISDSSSEEEVEIEDSPVPSPQSPPVLEPEESVAMETKEEPKEEEDDDDDVIPSTPQNGIKHKHSRRRKLVPKTYMDDDGFMVTEKVMESESASEVEEEPKPSQEARPQPTAQKANQNAPKRNPPPKKTSPRKKTAPPSKGNTKQMSLTSFFSKK